MDNKIWHKIKTFLTHSSQVKKGILECRNETREKYIATRNLGDEMADALFLASEPTPTDRQQQVERIGEHS